jgi:hypothetical protein
MLATSKMILTPEKNKNAIIIDYSSNVSATTTKIREYPSLMFHEAYNQIDELSCTLESYLSCLISKYSMNPR